MLTFAFFLSACGSKVTATTTGTGGAGGTGPAYEPSHCVGLDHAACCAANVNGCLWMDFEHGPAPRGGECAAESDFCHNDDAQCPEGHRCLSKFSEGICEDGTDEHMTVCYSTEKWDCPGGSDPCTWIGD